MILLEKLLVTATMLCLSTLAAALLAIVFEGDSKIVSFTLLCLGITFGVVEFILIFIWLWIS